MIVQPGIGQPDQSTALVGDGFGVAEIRSHIRNAGEIRALASAVAERKLEEIGDWAALAHLLNVSLPTIADDSGTSYSTVYRLLQARQVQSRPRGVRSQC